MLKRCPGLYCGRTLLENNTWSDCGSCPRGFRVNSSSDFSGCFSCSDSPSFYDWLYLGFMMLLALVLHWFFIDMVAMRRSFTKDVLILHFTAFVEMGLACVLTLLLSDPMGTFYIRSCATEKLSDWYTLFHNPNPNYETTLHCTQEAVYPLYTMVLMLYAWALVLMLLVRPWVCRRCLPRQSKMSVYAAMYFLPVLALFQAVAGGLIYYSFPYMVVCMSVVSMAAHLAIQLQQGVCALLLQSVADVRHACILLGHWALHAYGIVAITRLTQPALHAALCLLVPLPAAFYILTARFTDPTKLHID